MGMSGRKNRLRGGEEYGNSVKYYHFIFGDNAHIHRIRIDGLCGVDGGKPLPTTIRQRNAKAYRMVPEKILTGFVQKILAVY